MTTPPERVSDLSIPRLLTRLWRRLRPRRRKQIVAVSLMMIVGGFAEVATIGAVIPFIMVLVEPERVLQFGPAAALAQLLNLDQPEDLVLPLTAVFFVVALLAAATRLTVLWLTTRMAMAIAVDLSVEAYERTLYQPYATHINRNSSDVTSGVIHKVETVGAGLLTPLQNAVGSIFTIIIVTVALILINPVVAVIAMSVFGVGYVLVTRMFRKRLDGNSQQIAREQTKVIKTIQEGIGGIRDVLIGETQPVFLDQFRETNRKMRYAQGSNSVISQAPRVLMEGVAMVLVSILAIALSRQPGGIVGGLPFLGALALGGQRLLPLYQQCYQSTAMVLGQHASLVAALEILNQPLPVTYGLPIPPPLKLQVELECRNLRFRYNERGPWVINDLNLAITKGTRVGMAGMTGSGKSTLLDLLMGLLSPSQGAVLVDGQLLEGNRLRAWQQSIAHVPQHIFLADAPMAENIALGIPAEDIEMDRVREAASRAMIAEFVEHEPMGYATVVGERGIRLSGGQRQRIGIARALYKQASVLVFDEATSALDSQTERSVISSLASLDREVTVIIVAHRLSTLKDCDVIVELTDGRIAGEGTYEGLMSTSATFREMALGAERVT